MNQILIEQAAPNIQKFLKIRSASDPLLDQLEGILEKAQDLYYNTQRELISDADYDTLEDLLKKYRPKSKALRTRAPVNKKIKVKLPVPIFRMVTV